MTMRSHSIFARTLAAVLAAGVLVLPTASPAAETDYLQHGQEIAVSTQAALGKNLMQAIGSGGTLSAIQFCHQEAAPIAQRMSAKLGASVTRVTDRPRNPDNAANQHEMQYINAAKGSLLTGGQPSPAIQEIEGRMVGYYPVITNAMCLQCHGTPGEELMQDTIVALDALYPNDQATGYGVNELRGIFVVNMEKE